MKKILALAIFPLLAMGGEVEPVHFWNFDKLGWDSRQAVDTGTARWKRELSGRIATGQGTDGSDALRADADGAGRIVRFPLAFDAFTFDCKLRFATPPTGLRPVVRYATSAADKDIFAVVFADRRLTVKAGAFAAVSEPLSLADGIRSRLRLSVTAEGCLRAWLDGRLVLDKTGAPSLRSLGEGCEKDGYPTFAVGGRRGQETLDGVMDDIAFYDRALEAPETPVEAADYSNLVLPEYRKVPASKSAEVLVLGPDGRGETGRFRVSDVMDAKVFGQMNAADSKFVAAASSANVTLADGKVTFDVACPVPPGLKVEKQHDLWNGDYVVVRVRPKLDEPDYICYCVNVTGASGAGRFGGGKAGWRSKAAMCCREEASGYRVTVSVPVDELFGGAPQPGDSIGINFSRYGRTCGNSSNWATVGGAYNDATHAFGTLVVGGAAPYFTRRLETVRARAAAVTTDEAARRAVEAAAQPVAAAIAAHGAESAAFASVEAMFGALEKTLVAVAQKGRPLLVCRTAAAWGNAPAPTAESRPLEFLRLRTPRNLRSVVALTLTNFRDIGYTGNVKFFDRDDGFYRTGGRLPPPKEGVARHFTLRRAVEIYGRSGRPLYDPIVELPLGTAVEVAAGTTLPVFAELDTHGVAPGRHYALLLVKSATPGFADIRIGVEVTVTDDDPDVLPSDRRISTHLATSFGAGGCPVVRPCVNCVKKLVERGLNVVFLSRIDDMYPTRDANGVWQAPSYEVLDRYVGAWLAGGLSPARIKLQPYIGVEREKPLWKGLRDHTGKRIPFGTRDYDVGLVAMVDFFNAHVKARFGIGKDRVIWLPVDEPGGLIDDPELKSSISRSVHCARLLKKADPANLVAWNPLATTMATDAFHEAIDRLIPYYDYTSLYRPKLTARTIRDFQRLKAKNVWAYHITGKDGEPAKYRAPIWQNLRDGFSEVVSFWHLDESAAFDSGPRHPYGSCYIDWDNDELILSRRQLAADMAAEEGRLVNYLRLKFKADPAKLAQVNDLVKSAADAGTMTAIDAALARLLDLL